MVTCKSTSKLLKKECKKKTIMSCVCHLFKNVNCMLFEYIKKLKKKKKTKCVCFTGSSQSRVLDARCEHFYLKTFHVSAANGIYKFI